MFLSDSHCGRFDPPSDEESELVEFLDGARPNSRLSCQLIIGDHDEVHVEVVDSAV